MIVMEKRPLSDIRATYEAELLFERTDISFYDLDEDRVRIQIVVSNAGEHRSQPTPMRLQSAPLGAFVPWQPLARLLVPSLEPGQSRELSVDVARPRPAPLGDFNRIPPKKLLTALSSQDQPLPRQSSGVVALLDLLRRGQPSRSLGRDRTENTSLAPDLMDLMGRGQPHWAGNINVFVGSKAVERHLARALRIYPGRANLAMFVVGGPGRRDAYSFELVGLAPSWKAGLYDMKDARTFTLDSSNMPIAETLWVESDAGGLIVMLATHPPADCKAGNLEVHVTRRSDQNQAIVEFDLNPAAQGTGCYFV
jgi:hypothetical protein